MVLLLHLSAAYSSLTKPQSNIFEWIHAQNEKSHRRSLNIKPVPCECPRPRLVLRLIFVSSSQEHVADAWEHFGIISKIHQLCCYFKFATLLHHASFSPTPCVLTSQLSPFLLEVLKEDNCALFWLLTLILPFSMIWWYRHQMTPFEFVCPITLQFPCPHRSLMWPLLVSFIYCIENWYVLWATLSVQYL